LDSSIRRPPQALLLGFLVRLSQPGNYRLAQAVLSHGMILMALKDAPKYRSEIIMPVTGTPTIQYQQKVMNVVERVNAYKLGTQCHCGGAQR
jgi:hypothetical protein